MQGWDSLVALIFPDTGKSEIFVIAFCFTIIGLVFDPEMPAARFLTHGRIATHQLAKLQEVSNAASTFKLRV